MVSDTEKQRVARITGERLKAARLKSKLSVVEVAQIGGCNHNQIQDYEFGRRAPSQAILNSLRKALNIKKWDII